MLECKSESCLWHARSAVYSSCQNPHWSDIRMLNISGSPDPEDAPTHPHHPKKGPVNNKLMLVLNRIEFPIHIFSLVFLHTGYGYLRFYPGIENLIHPRLSYTGCHVRATYIGCKVELTRIFVK